MSLSGPTEFEAVAAESGLTGSGLEPEGDRTHRGPAGRDQGTLAHRPSPGAGCRRDKVALAGGVVIVLLVLVAVFADVIAAVYGQTPYKLHNIGSDSVINDVTGLPIGPFSGISGTHWLGVTPLSGQDILANLSTAPGPRCRVSILATALSLVLGISLGAHRRLLPRLGRHDHLPGDGRAAVLPDAAVLDRADHGRQLHQLATRRCGSSSSCSSWASSPSPTSGGSSAARCSRCARRSSWRRRAASAPAAPGSWRARSPRTSSARSSSTRRCRSRTTCSARPGCRSSALGLIGAPSWGQMLADAGGYLAGRPLLPLPPRARDLHRGPRVQPLRRRAARRARSEVDAMTRPHPPAPLAAPPRRADGPRLRPRPAPPGRSGRTDGQPHRCPTQHTRARGHLDEVQEEDARHRRRRRDSGAAAVRLHRRGGHRRRPRRRPARSGSRPPASTPRSTTSSTRPRRPAAR